MPRDEFALTAGPSGPLLDRFHRIDVDSREWVVELACLLPEARVARRSVEIRAVMHSTAAAF